MECWRRAAAGAAAQQQQTTPHGATCGVVVGAAPDEACSACPVCGVRLADVSATALGREAHVNGCIDAAAVPADGHAASEAAAGEVDDAVGPPPDGAQQQQWHDAEQEFWHPSDGGGDGDCPCPCEDAPWPAAEEALEGDDAAGGAPSAAAEEAAAATQAGAAELEAWLAGLGLARHAPALLAEELDLGALADVTDADLQGMGVAPAHERAALLAAAERLHSHRAASSSGSGEGSAPRDGAAPHQQQLVQQQQQQPRLAWGSGAGGSGLAPVAPPQRPALAPLTNHAAMFAQPAGKPLGGERKITSFLLGGGGSGAGGAAAASASAAGSRGSTPPAAPASRGGALQQARPPTAAAGQAHAGGQQVSGPLPGWVPSWHTLPGTRMVVDYFQQRTRGLACRNWMLTHFHADHYGGLIKGFKQGTIHCTPVTAALVEHRLKVPAARLHAVPLGEPFVVEGTRLTFVDANHCPGAAMVVAEPPNGLPPVVHTGDARLTAAATQACPHLGAVRGRCILVLDTTYCDPQYTFPPQQEVIDYALRAVQAELWNPRVLFLFGTYTIGKERLFLQIARALGRKVYVAAAKRGVMARLGLAPEYASLLTHDHLETNFHAVPMNKVTMEGMEQILAEYRGRYTAVVGFQPTGWTHQRDSKGLKAGRRLQRGTVVLYKVPYSEHSSFSELRQFVAWLRPVRIVPSVNADSNGPKALAMVAALTTPTPPGPMERYLQRGQLAGGAAAAAPSGGVQQQGPAGRGGGKGGGRAAGGRGRGRGRHGPVMPGAPAVAGGASASGQGEGSGLKRPAGPLDAFVQRRPRPTAITAAAGGG